MNDYDSGWHDGYEVGFAGGFKLAAKMLGAKLVKKSRPVTTASDDNETEGA